MIGHRTWRYSDRRLKKTASGVGLSLVVLVLLLFGFDQVSARLLSGFAEAAGDIPEWVAGLFSLVKTLVVFGFSLRCLGGVKKSISAGQKPGLSWQTSLLAAAAICWLNYFWLMGKIFLAKALDITLQEPVAAPQTGMGQFFFFLLLFGLSPLLEELFYRGGLQRQLDTWGCAFSLVFTSLLFVSMHASLWDGPVIFLRSMILGYVAFASRSLLFSILLHSLNNVSMLWVQSTLGSLYSEKLLRVSVLLLFLGSCALVLMILKCVGPQLVRQIQGQLQSVRAAGAERPTGLLRYPVFVMGVLAAAFYFIKEGLLPF